MESPRDSTYAAATEIPGGCMDMAPFCTVSFPDGEAESDLEDPYPPCSLHSHKRKYRRHPLLDPNEPSKPPSAYVAFANELRYQFKNDPLSFSELAKLVGDRWKTMHAMEKKHREEMALRRKTEYHAQIALYRSTPEYKVYCDDCF
jgi:hypothetical protein